MRNSDHSRKATVQQDTLQLWEELRSAWRSALMAGQQGRDVRCALLAPYMLAAEIMEEYLLSGRADLNELIDMLKRLAEHLRSIENRSGLTMWH